MLQGQTEVQLVVAANPTPYHPIVSCSILETLSQSKLCKVSKMPSRKEDQFTFTS